MALVLGNATVATGMSPIVESALYADKIFIDGVTFNSDHMIGNAGQIQVVVSDKGDDIEPKIPGSDFTNEDYKNTVVDINCNNGFSKSVKVPDIYTSSMPVNVLMENTWKVTNSVAEARQNSGLAVLSSEGTQVAVTDVTVAGVKKEILTARSKLRKKHVRPDVVLCSVDMYSAILEYAGKDFIPMFNDDIVRNGFVGKWLGMTIIEADSLDLASTYKYMKADGTLGEADMSNVNYIMYDHRYWSIIDRLDSLRVMQSEMFAGSKVQEEIATGFKVTVPDAVHVGVNAVAERASMVVPESAKAIFSSEPAVGIDD